MLPGKAQYLFSRSQVAVQNPLQPLKTHAEHILEHRAVKRLFAAEIVVKKRFVHAGGPRDGVGSGTVRSELGELQLGGLKDQAPAMLGDFCARGRKLRELLSFN